MAVAISVYWFDYVLRRENGLVLSRALKFEVRGRKETGMDIEEKEIMKVCLYREDVLC